MRCSVSGYYLAKVPAIIQLKEETFFHYSGRKTEAWAGDLLVQYPVSGVLSLMSRQDLPLQLCPSRTCFWGMDLVSWIHFKLPFLPPGLWFPACPPYCLLSLHLKTGTG